MIISDSYSDYIVYPNESIDKLTVNRVLYRMYKAIAVASGSEEGELTVTNATTSDYGMVIRSELPYYQYMVTDGYAYHNKTVNIGQILDFARGEYASKTMYDAVTVKSEPSESGYRRCINMEIGETTIMHMPNGVRMLIFSFDIGIGNLMDMFGSDVASGSHDVPIDVYGYDVCIPDDDASRNALNSVYGFADSQPLTSVLGYNRSNQLSSTYVTRVKSSIHHHECNWLSYSSYKQSCVELTYSVSFGVRELYEGLYAYRRHTDMGNSAADNTVEDGNDDVFLREFAAFQSNPIVIPQLVFYNGDSCPRAHSGMFNGDVGCTYLDANAMGCNPITPSDSKAVKGGNEYELPLVDGDIIMRPINNSFRNNGHVRDNEISFDVVYRFMAGGADDPCRERLIKNIKSKSRVQIMMIGI